MTVPQGRTSDPSLLPIPSPSRATNLSLVFPFVKLRSKETRPYGLGLVLCPGDTCPSEPLLLAELSGWLWPCSPSGAGSEGWRGSADGLCLAQGTYSEVASISNLGSAMSGPIVEEPGSLLMEYVNGSACVTSDGVLTTYSTRIHLVCSRGAPVSPAPASAINLLPFQTVALWLESLVLVTTCPLEMPLVQACGSWQEPVLSCTLSTGSEPVCCPGMSLCPQVLGKGLALGALRCMPRASPPSPPPPPLSLLLWTFWALPGIL